jgi:hypothetical protein
VPAGKGPAVVALITALLWNGTRFTGRVVVLIPQGAAVLPLVVGRCRFCGESHIYGDLCVVCERESA